MIEYADPQCPACRLYTEEFFPTLVDDYVRPGKVKTEFRGFPFIGDDSVKAYRFLLAAAEQDKLWNLAEALYRNQGRENSGWVTDDLVRRLAGEIPGLDVDKLFADAGSERITQQADERRGGRERCGDQGHADVPDRDRSRAAVPRPVRLARPDARGARRRARGVNDRTLRVAAGCVALAGMRGRRAT